MFSSEQKTVMLKAARNAVSDYLCGTALLDHRELSEYQGLRDTFGAFVTLKKKGQLRGCIGNIIGREPLYLTIPRLALEAAVHDPRFYPLECGEMSEVIFEISVLTHPAVVGSYEEIVIGRDGILLVCENTSSVFLPQVAAEQKWDLNTTLDHLCIKAGLHPGRWKDPGCSFEVFQAEVFSEE